MSRRLFVTAGVAAGVLALGVAAWCVWPRKTPPIDGQAPPDAAVQDVAAYLSSEEFAALDESQRETYIGRVAEEFAEKDLGSLFRRRGRDGEKPSEEERKRRRSVMRPLMQKIREKQLDKFFALPEKEKVKYLDRQIDRMLEQRKEWQKRREERQKAKKADPKPGSTSSAKSTRGTGPRRGRRFTPARIKQRIETTSPEERARREAYWRALRERMKSRGIKGPRRGPAR